MASHSTNPTSPPAREHERGTASAGTARQFHEDIENALRGRRAATNDRLSDQLRHKAKAGGRTVWRLAKRHPFVAVVLLGAAGTAAAAEIGVAELTLGGALAFAAYKVLRQGEPPLRAIEEVERSAGV
jgi:hypothetical protein